MNEKHEAVVSLHKRDVINKGRWEHTPTKLYNNMNRKANHCAPLQFDLSTLQKFSQKLRITWLLNPIGRYFV